MNEFTDLIIKLIFQGADPNILESEFRDAVENTQEWGLWGDMRWRKEIVCSKCGSRMMGICFDKLPDGSHPNILDSHNPRFHKNQLGVKQIPLKEWLKSQPIQGRLE
jgi:hypothetical protein